MKPKPTVQTLSRESREWLQHEYLVVGESWRFLTGIRFAIMAFAATLLSVLLGGFHAVVIGINIPANLKWWALPGIPIFGFISTTAIVLIDFRTRNLYGSCLIRGREIEDLVGVPDGHFHCLWKAPSPFGGATHTRTIALIYGMILATWLVLSVLVLYRR